MSTEVGQFPLYVTVEYLGMAGVKTVVRDPSAGPRALDGCRQTGSPELLGRAPGQLHEGRGHRPVVQVPGLGRRFGANDVSVRVPALGRARLLQAEARSGRARRQAGGRGIDRRLGPGGRQRLLAGPRSGRGLDAPGGRGDRDRRRGRLDRGVDGRVEAQDHAPGPRDADRPAAAGGRRRASDHEGRVLPRGQAHPGALAAAVHGRDRSRRGAAQADRPGRRVRRLGPAHRRGRVGHQSGQLAPGGEDPAATRTRPRATCASRSSCSRSRAASPSRSSSS